MIVERACRSWVMWRFSQDYETFLFGHAAHFEHELHEEHDDEEVLAVGDTH